MSAIRAKMKRGSFGKKACVLSIKATRESEYGSLV